MGKSTFRPVLETFVVNYELREPPVLGTPPNCQIRTWRFVEKTFRETEYFLQTIRFVKSKSQSAFQLFDLSLFSVLRVKNWSWNWNNQKKIAIQKKMINLKELGKYTQEKFDKYVKIENNCCRRCVT